jgi:hypothetical protein
MFGIAKTQRIKERAGRQDARTMCRFRCLPLGSADCTSLQQRPIPDEREGTPRSSKDGKATKAASKDEIGISTPVWLKRRIIVAVDV